MFETAELGRTIAADEYKARTPQLRAELLVAQQRLQRADFPVLVVFAGVDGAGKEETIDLLNEWLDPRWTEINAFDSPSDEERERPEFWRYWRSLPPKGRIGLFLSCWYSRPVLNRVYENSSIADFDEQLDRIYSFERELADDGALILKFWLHLSKKAQKRRFRKLEKDSLQSWRVTETDWRHWRLYEKFIAAGERALRKTDGVHAPWTLVEGEDFRYCSMTIATAIRDAIGTRLDNAPVRTNGAERTAAQPAGGTNAATVLDLLDMSLTLPKSEYRQSLARQQGRLNRLHRAAHAKGVSSVLVFCGWDAAGKGGAIRRLTAAMNARNYRVIPIAAPSDEEREHHYLWRFWRHLSRAGRVTIYDRSWYGRVLVERVEGFATPEQWMRAYSEINGFEEQLVEHGIVLVKYWLHITKDVQLARFREREQTEYKRWKLTEEDWRNREKWDEYALAVNDMIARTSTELAPWTLVEANDKRHARIKVLQTFCDRLEAALDD